MHDNCTTVIDFRRHRKREKHSRATYLADAWDTHMLGLMTMMMMMKRGRELAHARPRGSSEDDDDLRRGDKINK
jgi:hypothetical protein